MTTDSAARGHITHPHHHAQRPPARHGLRIVAAIVTALTFTVPVAAPAGAGGGLLGGLLNTLGSVLNAVPATLNGVLRFGASPLDEFANQPSTPLQPGQVTDLIGARPLRQRGIDGSGVDVALIDTGVAPVPGLDADGAVIVGPDLSFDSQGADMPAGIDAFGHGTHMASLIAGRGTSSAQGVAPGARILDMKVGAANGAVDVSQVIAAVNWVDQHRNDPGMDVRVINLSYGTDGVQRYQLDPLAHAVETAWRHGIVVVVAAGNSGGALTNPAIDPYVLTVGAADMGRNATSSLDDEVADFSSVGTTERRVDVVAPGVSLIGARVPGSAADTDHPEARVGTTQFRGSGTSQAAAVVSGAVALLLQQRPDLTPDQVKDIIGDSGRQADPLAPHQPGRRPAPRGHGREPPARERRPGPPRLHRSRQPRRRPRHRPGRRRPVRADRRGRRHERPLGAPDLGRRHHGRHHLDRRPLERQHLDRRRLGRRRPRHLDRPHLAGPGLHRPHLAGRDLDRPHLAGRRLVGPDLALRRLDRPHLALRQLARSALTTERSGPMRRV